MTIKTSNCGLSQDKDPESDDLIVVNAGCCQCPCGDDNCLLSYTEYKNKTSSDITFETLRQIAVEQDDKFMIIIMNKMIKRPKSPLKEACEACGRYSKNSKIHRACKKWWV